MENIPQQAPVQVQEFIDKAKVFVSDPTTPPAHRSVIQEILALVLKFLPVIIDIFHHATSAPVAPAPVAPAEPVGGGAVAGASDGIGGVNSGGDDPASKAAE